MNRLAEFFAYPFLTRALISGALLSLCAALLGTSLVLKRYSMIGDGLSHVGFGALALAMVLSASPLAVTLPIVIAAAFLLLRLSESNPLRGDAVVAMISSGSMAVGVLIVSVTTGMNTDVYNFMFGSLLSLSRADLILTLILSGFVIALYSVSYHQLFAVTFDETFARAGGISAGFWNGVLAVLSAVTIVLGMRMMGAVLISSLIIFPPLTAMRLCDSYRRVTITSAAVSLVCFFVGLFGSYLMNLPTGPSVVVANVICFALFSAVRGILTLRRKAGR